MCVSCQPRTPGTQPRTPGAAPRSAAEAAATARAALNWLASVDVSTLTSAEQAGCLRELERIGSAHLAARSMMLAGFDAVSGYTDDGQGSARSWLRWQTRVTGGAAADAVGWMRRLSGHRAIRDALAEGELSCSWARAICDWTEQLPEDTRDDADLILLAAAAAGAELADLGGLAEEMRRRAAGPDTDGNNDGYEDRSVRLDIHFRGAGRLDGELTPRCAAALTAVLEALGKKAGPEDTRTLVQRRHDALEEACRRLISAGCLPDRAGQATQIQLTMTLDQLASLNLEATAASTPGSTAGPEDDCDASIVPVVTGHVDQELLDRLAATVLGPHADRMADPARTATPPTAGLAGRAARELVLARALALLSGPSGLAAYLRGAALRGPAASISLPLDVGAATETIPPQLRRAVIHRDKHCSFPGCDQPPAGCQVHHVIPRSAGGATRLTNLALLCTFHHLIAVHRWGWTITLHGDGTVTATSPDRLRVLNGHGPPCRAA